MPYKSVRWRISRLGVHGGQECPFENRHVAAIRLTMPGRVAGDHPLLTLFAEILLQVVFPPVNVGWDTALSAGKIPHVHFVPLNVGDNGSAAATGRTLTVMNLAKTLGYQE
jgi:hypothetical protein